MDCPNCGCEKTYPFEDEGRDVDKEDGLERCSGCGDVFRLDDCSDVEASASSV